MKFIKNNFWTFCCLTLVMAMSLCGDAWASVMDDATDKVRNVFGYVRTITFILGGFGLVGVAYTAIIGKIKWTWFAGLAVGLAILGAAGAIIDYAGGGNTSGGADLVDSFRADK